MGKKNHSKKINKEECHIPKDIRKIAAEIGKTISRYGSPKSEDVDQTMKIKESCKSCKDCIAEQGHKRNMALINRYVEMIN